MKKLYEELMQKKADYTAEAESYWPGSELGYRDENDAFRHAYVSARFAQEYGADFAIGLGVLYEIKSDLFGDQVDLTPAEKAKDDKIDDFNNRIGAPKGEENKNATPTELAKIIADAVNNGETINDPNDPRSDDVPLEEPDENDVMADFKKYFDKFLNRFADTRDDINMLLLDKLDSLLDLFGPSRINLVPYRDPLILDLNGNGKIDVSAEGSGVYFDFNKDGIASSTGWLSGGADGDGLLVFDKNFDGVINDGTELFGDDFVKGNGKTAKNGFDALASLDSDKDGIISALDPMYHFLKVWRDTNGDGISQADELFSLAQLGITGLVTGHQDKDETLEGGNMRF